MDVPNWLLQQLIQLGDDDVDSDPDDPDERQDGEATQGFGAAMKCSVTKQQLFDTVAIHPTIAEELVCIPGIDQMPARRKYRDHKPANDAD